MQYQIKRGETVIATITPTGQLSKKIMGEDLVTMNFELPANVALQMGDYSVVFGQPYKLKTLTDLKKSSSKEYSFTMYLKGKVYDLQDANYMFPDADNKYTLSGQSLMGNLDTFIDLLIINANRDQTGWVKGVIDVTDFEEITFNADDTCLSVLATLATKFNTEWWVDGQTIHMTKKGVVEDFPLRVGKGNGLYSLQRTTSTEKNLVTRLYVYGSERNIPADYKGNSNRLKLPGSIPYLEKNVYNNDDPAQGEKYGVIEGTLVLDDVYPRRVGLVTEVADKITFTDSQLDFNINSQLLGVSAKVQFQTGNLAGYTFEINSYNNVTKQITLKYNQNDKNYVLPSDALMPAVGDQYILLDIAMPATYIANTENDLLSQGEDYLSKYCNPVLIYSVDCDPLDFYRKNRTLSLGNYVPIVDTDFGIDQPIRVISYTRDLQVTYQFKPDLADTVTIAAIVRNAVANENLKKTVERIGKTSNRAYNDALQAKSTAEGVKAITDFWGITLDAEHGLIASGTLLVGSGPLNNAGITGVVDAGASSVRFFAGAPYANKDNAIFRVLDNGKMFASNAVVTGEINAGSGKIGNFTITNEGLSNIDGTDAFIQQIHTFPDSSVASFKVGLQPDAGGNGSALAIFLNDKVGDRANRAIVARATGATDQNHAIECIGDFYHTSGDAIFNGTISTLGRAGESFIQVYKGSDGDNYFIEFKNGLAVRHGSGTG